MISAGPAAIVVPCGSRKRVPPNVNATALSLMKGDQASLETAWIQRLIDLPKQMPARQLYMGRGFALGARAARESGARLYVISAGLGLVDAERTVPSYGMTVGARGADAIKERTVAGFDPQRWWTAIRSSAFSIDWDEAFAGDGPVLIALTRTYAEMVVGDLLDLPTALRRRLRLFGLALPAALPQELADCVMPYDERLDKILKGTRTDFAQRALNHFVQHIAPGGDLQADRTAVIAALGMHEAPKRVDRSRQTDAEIIAAIGAHLRTVRGIGRILRRLRDLDGIACEQRRFTRLYHTAVSQAAAA